MSWTLFFQIIILLFLSMACLSALVKSVSTGIMVAKTLTYKSDPKDEM